MSTNTQYFPVSATETLVVIDARPMRVTNATLASYVQLQTYLSANQPTVTTQAGGDKAHHVAQALRAGVTMA